MQIYACRHFKCLATLTRWIGSQRLKADVLNVNTIYRNRVGSRGAYLLRRSNRQQRDCARSRDRNQAGKWAYHTEWETQEGCFRELCFDKPKPYKLYINRAPRNEAGV